MVDVWNGNVFDVRAFVAATGVTFPVLRDAGFLTRPQSYGINRDNFLVIDASGIVRYTSTTFPNGIGGWREGPVRAAIQMWLPFAVEARTWGAMKGLYR